MRLAAAVLSLIACGTSALDAQSPTMEETAAWFAQELPPIARAYYKSVSSGVSGVPSVTMTLQDKVEQAELTNCQLHLTGSHSIQGDTKGYELWAPLKLVDLQTVRVENKWTYSGNRYDPWPTVMKFDVVRTAGKPIQVRYADGQVLQDFSVSVTFQDPVSAERAARALQHAATLCGGTGSAF